MTHTLGHPEDHNGPDVAAPCEDESPKLWCIETLKTLDKRTYELQVKLIVLVILAFPQFVEYVSSLAGAAFAGWRK